MYENIYESGESEFLKCTSYIHHEPVLWKDAQVWKAVHEALLWKYVQVWKTFHEAIQCVRNILKMKKCIVSGWYSNTKMW